MVAKSREALRPRYRHVRRRDQRHARPVRRLPRRSQLGQGAAGVLLSAGILDQSDLNIEPTKAILRCEIAQMLYNMLTAAELI